MTGAIMHSEELTQPARSMIRLVSGLERCELDTRRLLDNIGVDPQVLQQPCARISSRKMDLLWQHAVDEIPDDCLPVDLNRLHPRGIEFLTRGVHGSPTLREATSRLSSVVQVLESTPLYSLDIHGGQFQLRVDAPYPDFSPLRQVAALAFCVEVWRQLSRCDVRPHEIHLALPEPASPTASERMRRFFGCEPFFGAGQSWLSLDLADVETPLSGWVTAGQAVGLADAVRRQLAGGVMGIEGVAMRLELSARTLQRRLAEEGVSFTLLLGEVRRDLAEQYLQEGRYTIKQIAYLLGFGNLSNFARTFRGWCGICPSEYQRLTQSQCHPQESVKSNRASAE